MRNKLLWLMSFLGMATGFLLPPAHELSLQQVIREIQQHNVEKIQISNSLDKISIVRGNGKTDKITNVDPLITSKIIDTSVMHDVDVGYLIENNVIKTILPAAAPLMFFLPLYAIFWKALSKFTLPFRENEIGAVVFSDDNNSTFESWGGSKEILRECRETVSLFMDQAPMVRSPKGILLEGPAGTGKTLLGRIIARQTNATFVSTSASEFIELFAGMGALRVRNLFKYARKNTPCILFIDEIDAIGQDRRRPSMGSDEREQTLNQLLYEMDGFHSNQGIMVLAATNRKEVLDTALLRPGRFDRIIHVPLPDSRSRKEILAIHCKGKKVEKGIDWDSLAQQTEGLSGADLSQLINEASIFAMRANQTYISSESLWGAFEKMRIGIPKEMDDRTEDSRRRVAIHELGHAIACANYPEYFILQKVSIQQTFMGAGGYTLYILNDNYADNSGMTKDLLMKQIQLLLAGRVAEEVFYGGDHISIGAYDDIHKASELCRQMVSRFGMSLKLGSFVGTGEEFLQDSEIFSGIADQESLLLLRQAYSDVKRIILDKKQFLEDLSEELLFDCILDGKEVYDTLSKKM